MYAEPPSAINEVTCFSASQVLIQAFVRESSPYSAMISFFRFSRNSSELDLSLSLDDKDGQPAGQVDGVSVRDGILEN